VESDTVARLGGDEFAFIFREIDASRAAQLTGRIQHALRWPLRIEGCDVTIGASIGIALYPGHGEEPGTLLRHADVAMYAAKRAGDDYRVYTPDHDLSGPARLALAENALHAERDRPRRARRTRI
jgi:diguanylate cyclase (GGDEF)-like protein